MDGEKKVIMLFEKIPALVTDEQARRIVSGAKLKPREAERAISEYWIVHVRGNDCVSPALLLATRRMHFYHKRALRALGHCRICAFLLWNMRVHGAKHGMSAGQLRGKGVLSIVKAIDE